MNTLKRVKAHLPILLVLHVKSKYFLVLWSVIAAFELPDSDTINALSKHASSCMRCSLCMSFLIETCTIKNLEVPICTVSSI